ncbi:MAG: lectin like domain-containing protein [Peptostreptococcaceae bacterium]|nr:lectin like domain-containing protein [Peptostreptococcaceae bacterium]
MPKRFHFNDRISGELKVYDVAPEDSWAAAAAGAFSGMVQRQGENDPQIDIWDIKDRMNLPEYLGDYWPLPQKDRINREGKSLGMGYFASQKGPKETSEGRDYSLLEVDFIEQKNQMKEHIYHYGPVIGFMKINLDSEKLYRKDTCAYGCEDDSILEWEDYNGLEEVSVLIVGWDDDFSADNFYRHPDPEDNIKSKGAWIVQLNRGKGVGKEGCIYVSYEDEHFFEGVHVVGYRDYATSKGWQDRVYEYDKVIKMFGRSNYLRWNTPNEHGKVYVMNVYDTKEIGEKVTGVGFTSPGRYKYEIWIAPDFKVGDGVDLYRSNHWRLFSRDKWYGPGYHTEYYDEQEQWFYPEALEEIEGEKFAVMLEIFTEGTEDIRICGSYYKEEYDGHKTEEGQSYYTNDIEDWKPFFYKDTEMAYHMNASIKVFTTKPSEPVEPSELKEAELYSEELLTGDVSKEWTIRFNKALDASSCTDETVRVYDAKTFRKVSITYQVDESALKITPDQPYSSGKEYYIYLGDIKDTGGKKLSKATKVLFKVE